MSPQFKVPLHLEYIGDGTWKLLTAFVYESDIKGVGSISVPAGFITDFASIPRGLWNLFPPTGPYGKAAVVHDFLYRESGVSRDDADAVFLEAMECLKVSWLTRRLVHRAVRIFGRFAYHAKPTLELHDDQPPSA